MKTAFLWFVATIVLWVVFFGDRSSVSTDVSTTLAPSADFQFSFDTSEGKTLVETQILTQINNYYSVSTVRIETTGLESTTVNPSYRLCDPLPDETIYDGPDGFGGCYVINPEGDRFFINPAGQRIPLGGDDLQKAAEALSGMPESQKAMLPLNPGKVYSTERMEEKFVQNGGILPLTWFFFSDEKRRDFLGGQPETWK